NDVNPALLARACNRLKPYAQSLTTDRDILSRQFFLLDFDPIRPSGISSTDAEHEQAIALAKHVRDKLRAEGFSEPVLADSGNGAHLLYPIEAPNLQWVTDQIGELTLAIAERFGTSAVTIDTSVSNPSRLLKLYGTVCCKGDDLPERPHRR